MRRTRLTFESLEAREVPASLVGQFLTGGAGDQTGTGVAVVDTGTNFNAFLSGTTSVNTDGVVNKFNVPYSLSGGSQAFGTNWPGQAGTDAFNSVAATASGVFAAGISYSQTTDTVGDKEHKGVVVGFNATGTPNWVRQTPNAPGAFGYGGYETARDVTATVENGVTYLYVTGSSQSNGVNGGRLFVSKVAANGAVVWTHTDPATTPNSDGYEVTVANGFVYAAGLTYDDGTRRGYVKKLTTGGALVWAKASPAGMFTSLVVDASGNLLAGGNTNGTTTDFLVQKWDAAGNVLWSRTFDRNGAADSINGLALNGTRLYGVGETRGGTAGGSDGIVLTFDPENGNLLDQNLWGGPLDDSLQDVTATANGLHVAGTTRSFGSSGSDLAYTVWSLNEAPRAVTLSPASVFENRPAGTTVGTLAAGDPNPGDSHTFSLVAGIGDANNAAFTIVGNELRTAASFDFEANSNYRVRVRATDAGGLWVESALAITVLDVNEVPSFTFAAPTVIVPNNTPPQTVLNWAVNRQNPEPGQALAFEVQSVSDPTLFATLPTITPDGTLSYAPAPGKTGTATVAVRLRDNGGTANGGVDVSPVTTFSVEVVGANLALNTAQSGLPSPLGSSSGWGGGSNKWDITDGRRSYPDWAHGLAFTGGSGNWVEPAGYRRITIDLAAASRFGEVFVWHHGADHTPVAVNLEYFNGWAWLPIAFTRHLEASFEWGAGSGSSWADRYTFSPVIGSAVRWSFDNRLASITGQQLTHGWVYEIEVIAAPVPPGGGGPVVVPGTEGGTRVGGGEGTPPVGPPRSVVFAPEVVQLQKNVIESQPVASLKALPVEPWHGFGLGDDDGIFFARV